MICYSSISEGYILLFILENFGSELLMDIFQLPSKTVYCFTFANSLVKLRWQFSWLLLPVSRFLKLTKDGITWVSNLGNLQETQVQISGVDEFDSFVFPPCFSSIDQLYSQNELLILDKENVTKTFEERTEDLWYVQWLNKDFVM